VLAVGPGAAEAAPPAGDTVFVSLTSSPFCGPSTYNSISAAVAAVPSGGTVVVCPGTYSEDVVVRQPVTIIGFDATVDPGTATNSPLYSIAGSNAFTVVGEHVTIEGFTVEGASGDGIFSDGDYSTFRNNVAEDNALTGIDLNASSWSTVANNTATDNQGGGFYLKNDVGSFISGDTASHDTVVGNVAKNNAGGSGIILADHLGAPGSGVNTAQGIFANTIIGNVIEDNGNAPAA
jgi:parallel beta-helix repeat protein